MAVADFDRMAVQVDVARQQEAHVIALELLKTMLAQTTNAGGDILTLSMPEDNVTKQAKRIGLAYATLVDVIGAKLEADYQKTLEKHGT